MLDTSISDVTVVPDSPDITDIPDKPSLKGFTRWMLTSSYLYKGSYSLVKESMSHFSPSNMPLEQQL